MIVKASVHLLIFQSEHNVVNPCFSGPRPAHIKNATNGHLKIELFCDSKVKLPLIFTIYQYQH